MRIVTSIDIYAYMSFQFTYLSVLGKEINKIANVYSYMLNDYTQYILLL